jgi:hypothetical protein
MTRTAMREPDVESEITADDGATTPPSRYDSLISLQLETDADFDLRRSAWRRVGAALRTELCKFLGCQPGLLTVGFDSPTRDDGQQLRAMTITVQLANGFRLDVPIKVCLQVATIKHDPLRKYFGSVPSADEKRDVLIAYECAGQTLPEEEHRWAAVSVVELEVSFVHESTVHIPLAYFLDDLKSKQPLPHVFSAAFQAITEEGEFTPRGRAPAAVARLGRTLEKKIIEGIREDPAGRAAKNRPEEALPPWL